MQQELIEMLEEIIPYVAVWKAQDQEVIDKAEALVEKAKNNNVPAGPQGEQINKALGKLRAAQWCHPNEVERLIDEAIDALVAATPAPAPAQEVVLTDEEIEAIAKKHMSTVGDHWSNEEAIREIHAEDFARDIIAALRAKGNKL